ncbi:MAG: GspH/FimT family pseudopilin [Marinobacter sp.]|uniref:GspH/FimT family pseudopilin n=1 Tax=Marinobacter sp. TaxID=50741 RepID=UPI00299D07D3|nr:GspH/FimT family pseudopilin [Marinobacter sp.]MDX1757270.1 GspH/FimT family pseudopilin [Marinobacter sp.]
MLFKEKSTGFTLIELMIVIALVGVIAAFAVPQLGQVIDNNRVVSTTNSIVGILNFSRMEAIRRGKQVTAAAAGDTMSSTLTSDATVLRQMEPAEGDLTISSGSVTFSANGMASANTTFTVCSGDATGRQVSVTLGGRVSSAEFTCP